VRPDDVGVDDDQRSCAHVAGDVPQHGHRSAARRLRRRTRSPAHPPGGADDPRAHSEHGSRHRAGDILKEDQGQNTCIFSTEFALG
jgi:hypothetical protein